MIALLISVAPIGAAAVASPNISWFNFQLDDGYSLVSTTQTEDGWFFVIERQMPGDVRNLLGLIDESGEVIVPFIYHMMDDFGLGTGLLRVTVVEGGGPNLTERQGVIDMTGNEVIPVIYDVLHPYFFITGGGVEVLFRVLKDNMWGLLDGAGNEILPLEYDMVIVRIDGIHLMQNGRVGIMPNPIWDTGSAIAEVISFENGEITILSDYAIPNASIIMTGQRNGVQAELGKMSYSLTAGTNRVSFPFPQNENIQILLWENMRNMRPIGGVFSQ